MGVAFTQPLHADDHQHFIDNFLPLQARLATQTKADVVVQCHVGKQGVILKDHAQPPFVR